MTDISEDDTGSMDRPASDLPEDKDQTGPFQIGDLVVEAPKPEETQPFSFPGSGAATQPSATIDFSMEGRSNRPHYNQADIAALCGWMSTHGAWWMTKDPYKSTFLPILDQARLIDALLLGLVREARGRDFKPAPMDPSPSFLMLERALRKGDVYLSDAAFKVPGSVRRLLHWIRTTNRWWMFRLPYRKRLESLWIDPKVTDNDGNSVTLGKLIEGFVKEPSISVLVKRSRCPDPSKSVARKSFAGLLWLSIVERFWAFTDPRPRPHV